MSRSPTKPVNADLATDYIDAQKALFRLVTEGKSWSGHERHCAFLNTGGSRFATISATSGLNFKDDGRATAYVDWDHDGDLDLWIANRSAPQIRFLRNDTPTDGHFLAIRLEGQSCNRDAIGARVEVVFKDDVEGSRFGIQGLEATSNSDLPLHHKSKIKNQKLTKTVYGGHGYLAQSTKWLHFGLGQKTNVDRVVVRWPGGPAENFTGIEVDRYYVLIQDNDRATRWFPPDRRVHLAATDLEGEPPVDAGRIVLATPTPLPSLTYNDFIRRSISLTDQIDGPTLINLWATWCVPCQAELRALSEDEQQLRSAGLRIIALSIDGLDQSQPTSLADAKAYVEKMGLPFDSGMANADFLDKLQILHDAIFYKRIPLAVPTSFLIDRHRQVAAVYRGPVSVDQLRRDVEQLNVSPARRDELARPFPGRWAGQPQLRLEKLAARFDRGGFLDDGIMYMKEVVRTRPHDAALYADLGVRLIRRGKPNEALTVYKQAVELNPNSPTAHYNLGIAYALQNNLQSSMRHVRQALQLDQDHAKAHFHLGMSLLAQNQPKEGMVHLRDALRLAPNDHRTHYHMGLALLEQGQVDEALEHLQETLRYDPDQLEALNAVASILAKHNDPELRRPQEAIQLAQRASELTGRHHPVILETLAAAYASAGEFDMAVSTAQTALSLASQAQDETLAERIRKQLAYYTEATETANVQNVPDGSRP